MNALLCVIILNILNLLHWRDRSGLRLWLEQTQNFLKQLEARQYDFSCGPTDPCLRVFPQLIQMGRLQPGSVRSLLAWIRQLEQDDNARRRLGYSSVFRLSLGACLGLATSLMLEGQWLLRLADNPPVLLLIVGGSLLIWAWLNRLKPHPLADSRELQAAFAAAWLGDSRSGPWHETWMSLQTEALSSGRDRSLEKKQLLEDWVHEACREQEKRMIWAEELFGLVELAGSVYFLGTACALPLLKQWGA